MLDYAERESWDGAMKARRRSRPSAKLLHLRWTSYAIAAGATAAGAIPAVEAEIHYSGPIDYKFAGSSTFFTRTFPLSNGAHLIGAINIVRFLNYDYAYFGVDSARISNAVRGPGQVGGFFQLDGLPGKRVVSDGNFFPTPFYRFAELQNGDCDNPDWQERGTSYVGFRFNTGGGPQYGWARIGWTGCPRNEFIVKDYAWGDPGDQIKTGQKKLNKIETAAPAADAQGSLGLLALGAIGLQAWRAKRRE